MRTRRSGCGYGRSARSTACTTQNTAAAAPIATARTPAAVAVNPGLRRSERSANRMSAVRFPMESPFLGIRVTGPWPAHRTYLTRAPNYRLRRRGSYGTAPGGLFQRLPSPADRRGGPDVEQAGPNPPDGA